MNYEEKYKQALERAETLIEKLESTHIKGFIYHIFPELKESKDERIRKALIELVHDTTGDSLWVDYNAHKDETLAWLEKQKENMGNDGKISINPYMGKEEFKKLVESNIINTSITWQDTIDQLWELYRKRLDPDTVVEWLYEQINSGSMQVDNISKTETTFKKDFGL